MGVMGLGIGLPRPVEDVVVQQTLVEVPDTCGRCGSFAISFTRQVMLLGLPRRVSCFMCGWDAFLVMPSEAPVIAPIEIEQRALGRRATVAADAPPVRSARPRGGIDRRKRPTNIPEPPPKYAYKTERPLRAAHSYGVEFISGG
jgi:hypothetical protein